ncbi:MAG: Peptidoglycan glycosyltransferase [Candidatus Roizmanbacteria bacterium GW2011_GWC2_37_13]|uniref:Peptidoglycan glycosyltransferase n=1 Tax=Candidatus Roizmanbacteria bacterium GW2011_GWC2_37_13 TaxID=1618486 RepID=A0A0G0JEA6_9BACT|nr:MAG: Peptidoglycan glycosyltransferase [Candidatus Roizmanbacteria bacterium GW2011_GWC1_37_12]KKQ26501.1 MAG: Peptidoglycan glycosyltransferase [Candidatus Roizmanbacteria bacterium GW2011_GWC2_37_13]
MKTKFLFIIFLLFYLGIVGKLFYLQIISPQEVNKNLYLKSQRLLPERGRIYDRNKTPFVLNQNSYLLYLEPKKITDKLKLVKFLSEKLEINEASLSARIDESKDWISITNNVDEKKKKEIENLKISGIGFENQMKRSYPEASLSAHLLGFVGKDKDGEDIGYFGLEGYYDKDLFGLPGLLDSERDIIGRPIFLGIQNKVEPENGRDLILTIDKTVQEIAKKRLLEGLSRYQAKQGCVIIADPNTMAILSLVCLPDYDLEKYYQFSENYFKNPAISDLYEPGSIFKPLIMAAAIEEKKVKPQDIYDEKGPIQIGEYQIKTWNNKYEGKISMTRILEKSSNVGMVYIGEKLGKDKIYQYLEKYGFGELTGVDLQGENSAYFKPKSSWYPIDFSTVTFGQGIALTPIQMIRAFASLINGGYLMKPYVVEKIVSSSKETKIKPRVEKRIISGFTSEVIKKMLVSTIENAEAVWDRPKDYKIGGKTGTAQIAIQGHYDPSLTNASFIGFAPADKPKFIALVILKEPKTSPWGSETAAPIFFEIAKDLIVYYGITPEQ